MQILKGIKYYFFIILVYSLFNWNSLAAQSEILLSFHFDNEPLEMAFKALEKKYNLLFSYNQDIVQSKQTSQIQVKGLPLQLALENLLHPLSLKCEILDNRYVLITASKPVFKDVAPSPNLLTICGKVLDSLSQEPLPFANISLKGAEVGVFANKLGDFQMERAFQKTDQLEISYLGYKPKKISIKDLMDGSCQEITLQMQEFVFEDILIQDRAIALLRPSKNGIGIKLQPEELGVLPGWGDNDVLRSIQLLPGVQSTDESASSISIRGGTPDQNLVRWDGIPIYHLGHFFGMFSAFNPDIVDEVSVYRGGFGARFGGRVAGLVDISSRPEEVDAFSAGFGMNLINANAYIKTPIAEGKSALLIAGRRSFTDILESTTYQRLFNQLAGRGRIKEDQNTAQQVQKNFNVDLKLDPRLYFSDLNMKWVLKPNLKSLYSLSFYYGEDFLDYRVFVDLPQLDQYGLNDIFELKNWGINGNWEQRWSKNFESTSRILYSPFDYRYSFFYNLQELNAPVKYDQLNNIEELKLELDQSWKFHPLHTVHFGYHLTKKEASFLLNALEGEEEVLDVGQDVKGAIHTLYMDLDLNVPGELSVDFGFRVNRPVDLKVYLWEPRLSIDYQIKKDIHLKAGMGRYLQFDGQVQVENLLGLAEQLWFISGKESGYFHVAATQLSLGTWIEKNGYFFDFDLYQKRVSGLSTLNLEFNAFGQPFSTGNAKIWGVDVLLKKKWTYYSSWLSYSFGEVEYQFDHINNGLPFSASHNQQHFFSWTHILNIPNWEFSFNWSYGSGRPYTRPVGIFNSMETEEKSIVYEERNASLLPTYHRLDFSALYKFHSRKRLNGKIGLSVFNLYNRRNIHSRDFLLGNVDNTSSNNSILRLEREMLGITPNVFFQLEW